MIRWSLFLTDRVTLKIDVSHADHSHVIGRGGKNIKKVMMETQCHVHFPDSNRHNLTEKSNQVIISGHVNNVERARQKIRDILPILFTFKIPFVSNSQLTEYRNSTLTKQLQDLHGVEINYRCTYLSNTWQGLVSVKGLSINAKKTKEAVQTLIERHYGNPLTSVPVTMCMEMDSNQQTFLNNQKTPDELSKLVFQTTGARLSFSSSSSFCSSTSQSSSAISYDFIRSLQSSTLIRSPEDNVVPGMIQKFELIQITGDVDNVFLARQLLTSLLPVSLTFDIGIEESDLMEKFDLTWLCRHYDIQISIRNKPRYFTKAVVIKSVEKNIRSLYTVRSLIKTLLNETATKNYAFEELKSCGNAFTEINQWPLWSKSLNTQSSPTCSQPNVDEEIAEKWFKPVDDKTNRSWPTPHNTILNEKFNYQINQSEVDKLGFELNSQLRLTDENLNQNQIYNEITKEIWSNNIHVNSNENAYSLKNRLLKQKAQINKQKSNSFRLTEYNFPPRMLRAARKIHASPFNLLNSDVSQ